ncbi:MAG: ATP-binding cassette domain-containing protein [Spirochaetaceae bacterium]|nr:MAG: ATP-binding cassette domain-containing protein [Spirochaetaceae bacterium]
MIELVEVHKSYGSVKAVDGVSFAVDSGEIIGLLGPNGAGKTTILKILTGYHFADSGSARVARQDICSHPLSVKQKLGYLPENAPLYNDFTVAEYLRFVAQARRVPSDRQQQRCAFAIQQCGLQDVVQRPIAELSRGFRQRTGLAQAILHDPEILILDEPTSGLDPNQILEIRRLIRTLGRSKTVILSTHIMQEVEAVCDRVLILNKGRIAATGTAAQISAEFAGGERFAVSVIAPAGTDQRVFDDIERLAGVQHVRISRLERTVRISAEVSLEPPAATGGGQDGSAAEPDLRNAIDYDGGAALFDWAVARGVRIAELRPLRRSLEELFVELTR